MGLSCAITQESQPELQSLVPMRTPVYMVAAAYDAPSAMPHSQCQVIVVTHHNTLEVGQGALALWSSGFLPTATAILSANNPRQKTSQARAYPNAAATFTFLIGFLTATLGFGFGSLGSSVNPSSSASSAVRGDSLRPR